MILRRETWKRELGDKLTETNCRNGVRGGVDDFAHALEPGPGALASQRGAAQRAAAFGGGRGGQAEVHLITINFIVYFNFHAGILGGPI